MKTFREFLLKENFLDLHKKFTKHYKYTNDEAADLAFHASTTDAGEWSQAKNLSKNLTSAVKRNKTPQSFVAYRGTDSLNAKVGDEISHKEHFSSFSISPKVAHGHAKLKTNFPYYHRHEIHLSVPKGAHGAYLTGKWKHTVNGHTSQGDAGDMGEHEFLLHPKAKIRIDKITHHLRGWKKIYHASLIHDGIKEHK